MAEPFKTQTPQNQHDSSPTLSNFQVKAIFLAMFVVFLPILSSQAPDFVKQVVSNKMWELFQLLLVGIAVSCGLFISRKGTDQETEKESANEPNNQQNFVSDMLDGLPVFDSSEPNNPNVRSWSSMYNPNEPLVVVENEIMDGHEQKINKPLFLPIRSLNPIARDPKLLREDEIFQNYGDAEAPNSTNDEDKGINLNPSGNSNFGHSINRSVNSSTKKQLNNSQKITPQNFMCEQKGSNLIGKSAKTVRLKSSNSMDELIKTLEESESESDDSCDEEGSSNSSSCVTDDGKEENEVDKKADEFIAKFREQIRQQRMQCRKRSTARKGGGK